MKQLKLYYGFTHEIEDGRRRAAKSLFSSATPAVDELDSVRVIWLPFWSNAGCAYECPNTLLHRPNDGAQNGARFSQPASAFASLPRLPCSEMTLAPLQS